MNGSEPPSSSTTFFKFCPATAAPARSLPVTDTPAMRGFGFTATRDPYLVSP
jgi:hypothetical protein